MVAEVYGPDADTRRAVAHHLTDVFEQAGHITDVDNLMQQDYEVWRFVVDDEKALRMGVSVDAVNRTLEMAMGGFVLGDVKRGSVLEPTMIVLQLPLEARAEFTRMGEIPVPASGGGTVPLVELGRFVPDSQGAVIHHKDLRAVEYVVGDTMGRLGAPIYGMLEVDELLKGYVTPDGVEISGQYIGRPDALFKSGFEWGGEWTVTYETFRDMGIAFGVALILIYMLVVWQFGNFLLPAIVMAPIPLTLCRGVTWWGHTGSTWSADCPCAWWLQTANKPTCGCWARRPCKDVRLNNGKSPPVCRMVKPTSVGNGMTLNWIPCCAKSCPMAQAVS